MGQTVNCSEYSKKLWTDKEDCGRIHIVESSQGFIHGGRKVLTLRRRDEYGYFWSINLYVYIGFADSGYSDLKAGQVIANFILT